MPKTHILHKQVKRAANRYVNRHRSSLHEVMHTVGADTAKYECIRPYTWGPKWERRHQIEIAPDKATAKGLMDTYKGCHVVYSDGSGRDGKIGAAAVYTAANGRKQVRRRYLGPDTKHTVYEAELTGIMLALDIARGVRWTKQVYIMLDNQAAIKATAKQRARPGQTSGGTYPSRGRRPPQKAG